MGARYRWLYTGVIHSVLQGRLLSVITVRVPKEIKRILEKRRVNVSETVRALLEDYVRKLELKDLAGKLDTLKDRVGNRIDPEVVARLVREDRKTR